MNFRITIYRVLNKRSDITAPFMEPQKFEEKKAIKTFTLGEKWQNEMKKTRIRTLYILKLLCNCWSTKQATSLLFSN